MNREDLMSEGNEPMTIKDFEALARVRRIGPQSDQYIALMNMRSDTAMVFKDPGSYICRFGSSSSHCGLRAMAGNVARARKLISATCHLPDGRLAVAFYSNNPA